jgi:hypothetical protein
VPFARNNRFAYSICKQSAGIQTMSRSLMKLRSTKGEAAVEASSVRLGSGYCWCELSAGERGACWSCGKLLLSDKHPETSVLVRMFSCAPPAHSCFVFSSCNQNLFFVVGILVTYYIKASYNMLRSLQNFTSRSDPAPHSANRLCLSCPLPLLINQQIPCPYISVSSLPLFFTLC